MAAVKTNAMLIAEINSLTAQRDDAMNEVERLNKLLVESDIRAKKLIKTVNNARRAVPAVTERRAAMEAAKAKAMAEGRPTLAF